MSASTGAAAGFSPQRIEEMLPTEIHEKVLNALAARNSMAFLELTSVCDIEDDLLKQIISDLKRQDIVSVANSDDVFEEVITLRDKGFGLAKRLAKEKAVALTPSLA